MNKVKVYQACSWFKGEQTKHMKDVYKTLKENKTCDYENSYRPLDLQFEGVNVDENPEFLEEHYQQIAWGNETYQNDISGISNSDIGVFAWTPKSPDEGQSFEMGYMKAMGKPVLVVVPDGQKDLAMNLMVAYGATQVIELSELKDINLNKVFNKPYDGGLF